MIHIRYTNEQSSENLMKPCDIAEKLFLLNDVYIYIDLLLFAVSLKRSNRSNKIQLIEDEIDIIELSCNEFHGSTKLPYYNRYSLPQ